jgi:hypothetical protein
MPISFYPPDSFDFPFVANQSRLRRLEEPVDHLFDRQGEQRLDQRLDVPTFPQEPPADPKMPPPRPPDEAPETPLDEPPPVPVTEPPPAPKPPLVV